MGKISHALTAESGTMLRFEPLSDIDLALMGIATKWTSYVDFANMLDLEIRIDENEKYQWIAFGSRNGALESIDFDSLKEAAKDLTRHQRFRKTTRLEPRVSRGSESIEGYLMSSDADDVDVYELMDSFREDDKNWHKRIDSVEFYINGTLTAKFDPSSLGDEPIIYIYSLPIDEVKNLIRLCEPYLQINQNLEY